MLCVQESVVDSVVAHLRLRMAKMKCVTLPSEADRKQVDAAVQEAQQLGATVSTTTSSGFKNVNGRKSFNELEGSLRSVC